MFASPQLTQHGSCVINVFPLLCHSSFPFSHFIVKLSHTSPDPSCTQSFLYLKHQKIFINNHFQSFYTKIPINFMSVGSSRNYTRKWIFIVLRTIMVQGYGPYCCHHAKFFIRFWLVFDILLTTFWWLPMHLSSHSKCKDCERGSCHYLESQHGTWKLHLLQVSHFDWSV